MSDHRCPICKAVIDVSRGVEEAVFPFCSERCKMVDLGRWLSNGYSIPAGTMGEAGDEDDGVIDVSDSDTAG